MTNASKRKRKEPKTRRKRREEEFELAFSLIRNSDEAKQGLARFHESVGKALASKHLGKKR